LFSKGLRALLHACFQTCHVWPAFEQYSYLEYITHEKKQERTTEYKHKKENKETRSFCPGLIYDEGCIIERLPAAKAGSFVLNKGSLLQKEPRSRTKILLPAENRSAV
jgi:hypothetical protein